MKKKFKLFLILVLTIFAFYHIKTKFFPNEKDYIKRELLNLARASSFDKKEPLVQMLIRIGNITEFFTPDITFLYRAQRWTSNKIGTRNELSQKLAAVLSRLNSLEITFKNFNITVNENKATVSLSGKAKWLTQTDTQYMEEEISLSMDLIKKDSKWLIEKVENTKPVDPV